MANPLIQKTILLGVTGSIAAYKAADLASRLHKAGAKVDVVLTESALRFIQPLTFQSITGSRAYTDADLWGREGQVTHITLGRSADLFIIAPASANTLAKLANGIADNLLCLCALTSQCSVLIAPAMDAGMYDHPATKRNLAILQDRGYAFLGPAEGHLASGMVGVGRMVEPLEIFSQARRILSVNGPLKGKKVVITAGGTQEPIDPVRLITNRSSGKQGIALAQAALDTGADVTLISAAEHLAPPAGAKLIPVKTADQMHQAVMTEIPGSDALIMAAAVADFRPAFPSDQKIKKQNGLPVIELEPTADILQDVLESRKKSGFPRLVIGFAAESQDLISNAKKKLMDKGLDLIIANDILAADAGFEVDTNRVTLVYPDGRQKSLAIMTKDEVSEQIMDQVIEWL